MPGEFIPPEQIKSPGSPQNPGYVGRPTKLFALAGVAAYKNNMYALLGKPG